MPALSRCPGALALAAALLALPLRAQPAVAPAPRYRDAAAALERTIERERAASGIPALSIALVDATGTVWARGFGRARQGDSLPATAETIYRVGGAGELLADLAAARLVRQGKLALDAPAARAVPGFAPRNPFGVPVTLRHIVTHRAGLEREPPVGHYADTTRPSLAAIVASLRRTALLARPGTREAWSAAGVAVVARAVERASGEPFERWAARELLAPLGMARSGFAADSLPAGAVAEGTMRTAFGRGWPAPTVSAGNVPVGSFRSSAADLARLLRALLAGEGAPVVTPEMLRRDASVYGFSTSLRALPGDTLAVVVVASLDGATATTAHIAERAAAWMRDARAGRAIADSAESATAGADTARGGAPGVEPPPPPARWRGLIGEYGWDHDVLNVFERDGRLHALTEWLYDAPLRELRPGEFRFPEGTRYAGETLRFVRDGRGRAARAVLGAVVFPRRQLGPKSGEQLTIAPLRPIPELRAEALAAAPPHESGEFLPGDLVDVAALDSTIRLDIRYAGTNNFLGARFYSQPRALLQRPAAEALLRAHRALRALGYGVLVHDAYRPWYVTKMFWDATPPEHRWLVANPASGSRHNRGAAVDLTLYALATGEPVEMPGTYDELSDRSWAAYPGGTSRQRWHRELLRWAMEREGFAVNPSEWWHFDHRDWRRYRIGNTPFEAIGAAAR
ncbi:MAG TPA: serine hydrolase [Gemmatimonadaceae bacterium]|nr:serine hydrolase [Gemmatimonadaceae bacterium]